MGETGKTTGSGVRWARRGLLGTLGMLGLFAWASLTMAGTFGSVGLARGAVPSGGASGAGGVGGASGASGPAGDNASADVDQLDDPRYAAGPFTAATPIAEVRNDADLAGWGRLVFPVHGGCMRGDTLGDIALTWYSNVVPQETVDVCNYLKACAAAGGPVFLDIYTEDEKAADPAKADTGLFFFRGNPGGRVAFCNAGGGFSYVAAIHDSFPHALELARRGYNAFALVYRPNAQAACEDLARAVALVHRRADELDVDVEGYALWGGSAGARMAAWVGAYGTAGFGAPTCPQAGAVVMQYTGLGEVTGCEPPTYACVGTADGIADWRTMSARIARIAAGGTLARIEVFEGLSHGFGLGTGTVAQGWLDRAVAFWEDALR